MDDVAGVIFDLDGTLVDSGLDFAALRQRLGFPAGIGILEHAETLPAAMRSAALLVVQEYELDCASRATWMPGAAELLDDLAQRNMPMGIVTRNTRAAAQLAMTSLMMPALPLVAREDCAPKPDPAGLLMLAARWQLCPSRVLYVGDFLYDLQAAQAAGMPCCLYVPQGRRDYEAQATWVIRSFAELGQKLKNGSH